MKLLLVLLIVGCANNTIVDKKHKCVVELVKEGVTAKESAEACKYTFDNSAVRLDMRK
jgi:hypothetical protein